MRSIILVSIILLSISACTKTEVETIDVTIPGNTPPPDHTIDSATLNIYVNKAYINLMGREPVGGEKEAGLTILRQHNFSVDDRKDFISTFFSKAEYVRNLYSVANNEYLRNLDSMEIEAQIFQFNYLLGQPQYAPFYDYIRFELYRIDTLKSVLPKMLAGTMDYRQMLSRMSNNYFYDQINMGSENFVISTYQNFLFRYPSDAELLAGKAMVDGTTSTVFFKLGKSKYDYVDIFFDTDDYYEGQVRFIFKKYLFREPTGAEIYLYANIYKSTNNYKELEKAIFTTDEFAGI
jgi:hypothetical protein